MNKIFAGKAMMVFALIFSISSAVPVAASERLPKAFHGTLASDLPTCGETGELRPIIIDARGITEYEGGYSVRKWSRRGNVWIGRGKHEDDQGSTPATVRLRLRSDGTLNFDSSGRGPFPDEPGLTRCPAQTGTRR